MNPRGQLDPSAEKLQRLRLTSLSVRDHRFGHEHEHLGLRLRVRFEDHARPALECIRLVHAALQEHDPRELVQPDPAQRFVTRLLGQ